MKRNGELDSIKKIEIVMTIYPKEKTLGPEEFTDKF